MIKTTKTSYCPKKTPRFTLCVHDKNVMRQRTTGAPKPEKTRIFSTIHVLANKQHYKISGFINELLFQ